MERSELVIKTGFGPTKSDVKFIAYDDGGVEIRITGKVKDGEETSAELTEEEKLKLIKILQNKR
jgi:hypothetical protein